MNIVMFTNTFSPHVGGVARSVSELAEGLRDAGHNVLVVAPEFPGSPKVEANVIRIPALQQFAGTAARDLTASSVGAEWHKNLSARIYE